MPPLKLTIMDTKDLTDAAKNLQDKAQDLINNPKVQDAINKGKEWLQNGQGKEILEKGKDTVGDVVDKLEDFVEDKTDGKGIFGFGKKDDAPAK